MEKISHIQEAFARFVHGIRSGRTDPRVAWRAILGFGALALIGIALVSNFAYRWATIPPEAEMIARPKRENVSVTRMDLVIERYKKKEESTAALKAEAPEAPFVYQRLAPVVAPVPVESGSSTPSTR